ncbi:MAG TPA: hypothetical protein PL017_02200 [Tenuifilaceae bacterium]|nr:hypothetical protein [Tenuifilaceae bacterium]HPJ44881.1 hypothetical protein [Tenuifilaceae bacterium]HRX67086.1 hypothetical protein [Tenuifilaceae bacterium]
MKKTSTHIILTYQNYFAQSSTQVYPLNLIFDTSRWFEEAIRRYEEKLPQISDKLLARILQAVR